MEVVVDLPPLRQHSLPISTAIMQQNDHTTHIGRVARVGRLEGAGDLDRRARAGVAAAARHVELCTADVELRGGARVMDGQRLDPQQVLAAPNARRDVVLVGAWDAGSPPRLVVWGPERNSWDSRRRHTAKRPGGLPAAEGRAPVVDLEPVERSVVVLHRARRLGHVAGKGDISQ